ncbi:DNA-processing protein DprA [Bacteroides sp. OttesenSCG-928-D19]|nr:DNA-processing protein DprA [Bacteroides sp. OttesenSCG-928-D19]
MTANERLYLIGLTQLKGVGDVLSRHLLQYFGSAEEVFKAKRSLLEKVPGIGSYTAEQVNSAKAEALTRAEKELAFIDKNKIRLYAFPDDDYPKRLKECQDAPVVFYYRGTADLDAAKIISIVGTRRITDYGRKQTEALIRDLAAMFPDLVVVSGLAYGVDVCAHRNALTYNLPTVGVLAHGLDRIYPAVHRNTAAEMLGNGGLLTDFMSETNPDRENFLRRNRLIAGLADATIVVESAEKGGSLVTADIAFSYGRDVYAFSGRVTDEYSSGCNRLIQMNKAGLISSAKDLVLSLCWDTDVKMISSQQTSLPFVDKPDHPVIRLLQEKGEFHVNQLAAEMNLPIHKLTPVLFELELEGHIKALPGGIYKLT